MMILSTQQSTHLLRPRFLAFRLRSHFFMSFRHSAFVQKGKYASSVGRWDLQRTWLIGCI
jgi:hypothetical protein